MVATQPGKPEKKSIFKKASENLEKSRKTVEKANKSGKSQGIILGQC